MNLRLQSLDALHRTARIRLADAMPAWARACLAVAPQFSRYLMVSVTALTLDFAVFLTLTSSGVSPTPAAVMAYTVALMLHYTLSVRFVFDAQATNKMQARLFSEFALTGLTGIVITTLVVAVATGVAGLSPLTAKICAVAVSFVVVFSLRRFVVFAGSGAPPQSLPR